LTSIDSSLFVQYIYQGQLFSLLFGCFFLWLDWWSWRGWP